MIKVTMPFQSPFASGMMGGIKAGESLISDMPDPNTQKMQKMKMALLIQQLANAILCLAELGEE